MKNMHTKAHGVADYLVSCLLIVSPWLFNFSDGGAETWVPVILGAATIIYSLLTDYELGIARILSVPAHLTLDMWTGILLAGSPWILKFNDVVYLPHLIIGLAEVAVALFTVRGTYTHHRHAH